MKVNLRPRYKCDPAKNIDCKKRTCKYNDKIPTFARQCEYTLDKEFSTDGIPVPYHFKSEPKEE